MKDLYSIAYTIDGDSHSNVFKWAKDSNGIIGTWESYEEAKQYNKINNLAGFVRRYPCGALCEEQILEKIHFNKLEMLKHLIFHCVKNHKNEFSEIEDCRIVECSEKKYLILVDCKDKTKKISIEIDI